MNDGSTQYPYGQYPIGLFMYDSSGNFSVQIMKTPPLSSFHGDHDGSGDADDIRNAYRSFVAYFGKYKLDQLRGLVSHHVEGSLDPSYIGSEQLRPIRLDGRRLVIEMRNEKAFCTRELVRAS